ncbi:hypothetical protein ACSYDW_10860 [Paeniglutamicibacter sp. R2-26]|uniref:hypothetical protein n=1 Tax=Paeniglutamicibacter sp. R2-26 TaxID=3144417 RepID=UPI003EE708A7
MINLLPVAAFLGFGVALLLLVRKGSLSQRRSDLGDLANRGSAPDVATARRILRIMRARNISAFAAAVAGAVGAFILHDTFPQGFGLAIVVAPAFMWVLAAAVYALWPIPSEFPNAVSEPEPRLSADLTTRSAGMFGPAWGIVAPAVLLVATAVGVVAAGRVSGADENGLFRNFPHSSMNGAELDENMVIIGTVATEGASGPFPGWYYGVPVIVLLAVGAVLTLWALNSNARRPRLRSAGLRELDLAIRTHQGYVLSTGASAMLCFQALPLLLMALISVRSAASRTILVVGQVFDESSMPARGLDPFLGGVAVGLAVVALLLLVIGLVLLANLVAWMSSTIKPRKRGAIESATA